MPSTSTANQATMQLPGVASTSLEVIPRSAMTRAQSDLKWRGSDITVYARLTALAAAVHATYLVVGTIDRVSVDRLTNTANRANATVYIQVFTVAPPQLTQAVTGMGASSATVVDRAAEAALREAVKQALPAALAKASLGR